MCYYFIRSLNKTINERLVVTEVYKWMGSTLAIIMYFPTLYYIWTNKLKQSFATWVLWVILDCIALGSIIAQKGENTFVLTCYVFGGTLVWLSLLYKKQFKWGKKEWLTLGLVVLCMAIWKVSGAWWATIASTFAVFVSGIPQFIESYTNPRQDKVTGYIYIGYFFVNLLYFLAGKNWSVEDKFYPFMALPLCLAIAIAALRRRNHSIEDCEGEMVDT